MTLRLVAVAVAALLLPALGAASARRKVVLPESGIAVETVRGVELVDLQGRVRRSLRGFRFRSVAVERPGHVELRDRAGRAYELRAGKLGRVAAGTVTLPGGHALRFRGRWVLLRGGRIVERFPARTHVELDGSGTVLTTFSVDRDGARGHALDRVEHGYPRARDAAARLPGRGRGTCGAL